VSTPPTPSPSAEPVLLTSLRSAVLAGGRGDLSWVRETRGAPFDWGGVYAQHIRLTGPWTLELERDGRRIGLPECYVDGAPTPGGWRTHHRWDDLDIVQRFVASPEPAGAVRAIEVRSSLDRPQQLFVRSQFDPVLFPVLVEGIQPVRLRATTDEHGVLVRHHGLALRVVARPLPSQLLLNQGSWIGGKFEGRVRPLGLEHELDLMPGGAAEVRWGVSGGLFRDLMSSEASRGADPPDPGLVGDQLDRADADWLAQTPQLGFPDAPELTAAYRSARLALRRLYTAPGDGLAGLVAGYPWYSAIWSRDLAVMLPAVLWLGDFDWASRSLTTLFRFQSRSAVAVLGGEPGELPMQVSPGPIFLYGTSDSTLRFPPVIDQLLRHSGDRGTAATWSGPVRRIVEWARARTDSSTGLLRHGGEAEAIAATTSQLARVHYGIDSPDTTIWDSADRRDHAIDVQVLWWQALDAVERMGRLSPANGQSGPSLKALADRLAASIRTRYTWPEERYLYDSLRRGHPVPQLRPNALRAVSAGLLAPDVAAAAVARAGEPDLHTEWGLRTLSSRDPSYDPQAYHAGQVWTIATAWAADAAFAVGDVAAGLGLLRTIAGRYAAEGGWANECYRGDRAEAWDSCFVLGFSIAPFLTLLFERLWGLRVDGLAGQLRIRPAFPSTWRSATLRGLRIGGGRLDLEWTPTRLQLQWSGLESLAVDAGSGPFDVPSRGVVQVPLPPPKQA
jgi:hypothetical protein